MRRIGLSSLAVPAALLAIGSLAGCATSGAAERARAETLSELQQAMQWVRAGGAHDPRALEELPSVEALVGVRRSQLTAQIGAPRTCRAAFEYPCARVGETYWTFFRGYAADEVSGPVLVVDFDAQGVVTGAHWRRPEVAAPAPLGIPSSGGEEVAIMPTE